MDNSGTRELLDMLVDQVTSLCSLFMNHISLLSFSFYLFNVVIVNDAIRFRVWLPKTLTWLLAYASQSEVVHSLNESFLRIFRVACFLILMMILFIWFMGNCFHIKSFITHRNGSFFFFKSLCCTFKSFRISPLFKLIYGAWGLWQRH